MNSVDFNPQEKVIRVPTRLWGPAKELVALLLLDTGAEGCVLNEKFMIEMGYDLTAAPETMSLITVGGIVEAPRVRVARIRAFGFERTSFPITGYTPPSRAGVDGILGMDFFLGPKLTNDFRLGLVTLE